MNVKWVLFIFAILSWIGSFFVSSGTTFHLNTLGWILWCTYLILNKLDEIKNPPEEAG